MTMHASDLAEATAFFSNYAKSFDERDWDRFVGLYHVPALSVRADGSVKLMESVSQVDEFFRAVSAAWEREGYSHFTTSDLVAQSLGSRSMLVTFTWHMRRADDSLIKSWRQSYQLVRVDRDWRVIASTFHV